MPTGDSQEGTAVGEEGPPTTAKSAPVPPGEQVLCERSTKPPPDILTAPESVEFTCMDLVGPPQIFVLKPTLPVPLILNAPLNVGWVMIMGTADNG